MRRLERLLRRLSDVIVVISFERKERLRSFGFDSGLCTPVRAFDASERISRSGNIAARVTIWVKVNIMLVK